MSGEDENQNIMEAKFPFIREDVFLIARIDAETGKQHLVMQKVNLKTGEIEIEDEIECIHTAVMDVPVENFASLQNDVDAQEDLYNKTLQIRSSEKLQEINLTLKDKFIALKSWTAGIAEAGFDAFKIQDEVAKNLDLMYPITHFIMKFLIKVNSDFIQKYLLKIERECRFEGEYHLPSIMANIEVLIKAFEPTDPDYDDEIKLKEKLEIIDEIIRLFLNIGFSSKVYLETLFKSKNQNVRMAVARNPEAIKFKEYKLFFNEKNSGIKESIAQNPEATYFEEYKSLFKDDDLYVRMAVAENLKATKFREYKLLFKDDDPDVRLLIAGNPEAIKLKEYKLLFEDEEKWVREEVVDNPYATNFEEYKLLINDKQSRIRWKVAKNPKATKFEDYKSLFKDKDSDVRRAVAKNPEATKYKEFKILLEDEDRLVREYARKKKKKRN